MAEEEKEITAKQVVESSESIEETGETSEENADSTSEEELEEVEGKFGKAPDSIPKSIQKAPEEPKKHYQSIASKGATLQEAHAEILGANTKKQLKENLPKAIVVKKNFKKERHYLWNHWMLMNYFHNYL